MHAHGCSRAGYEDGGEIIFAGAFGKNGAAAVAASGGNAGDRVIRILGLPHGTGNRAGAVLVVTAGSEGVVDAGGIPEDHLLGGGAAEGGAGVVEDIDRRTE